MKFCKLVVISVSNLDKPSEMGFTTIYFDDDKRDYLDNSNCFPHSDIIINNISRIINTKSKTELYLLTSNYHYVPSSFYKRLVMC